MNPTHAGIVSGVNVSVIMDLHHEWFTFVMLIWQAIVNQNAAGINNVCERSDQPAIEIR